MSREEQAAASFTQWYATSYTCEQALSWKLTKHAKIHSMRYSTESVDEDAYDS